MAPRLSKIVTHTGDDGTTGLSDGSRISKDDTRIAAIGTIDELNSVIGVVLACDISKSLSSVLVDIQHKLFDAGAELATPGRSIISGTHADHLEQQVIEFNDKLPPLKEFILPGGTLAASNLHFARTVCRRAERITTTLLKQNSVSPDLTKFLNRLSDLLFVLARTENKQSGSGDIFWNPEKIPGQD